MVSLLASVTALGASLLITPIMIRLAPVLRMLDEPGGRKMHHRPVPRVGGWGITLGALLAIALWLPLVPVSLGFIFGGLALLCVGAADDRWDLPAGLKLAAQLATALLTVVYAGIVVDWIPLFGGIPLAPWAAITLTVIGLVVCINATNTSDGLDGLAAGVSLLSIAAVLYLGALADSVPLMLMAAAAIGSLIGFLRYNTHPAALFMGDAGSQFLGFAIGFLGLALVHAEGVAFSPWALLLLIGLPAADLAVVASRRILRGTHPFRPDKTHIHHRLMTLGFGHNPTVVLIYALQASFVFFAIALRDSQSWIILMVYVLHLAVIYGFLYLAERSAPPHGAPRAAVTRQESPPRRLLVWAPRVALETLVPITLVALAALASTITPDAAVVAALLMLPLVVLLVRPGRLPGYAVRVPTYLVITLAVYLYTADRPFASAPSLIAEAGTMAAIAIAAAAAVWCTPRRRAREFRTTGVDYLLLIFAPLAFLALQGRTLALEPAFLLYLPVLLYATEIITVERRQRPNWLPAAALAAALIIALRGLSP